MIGVRVTEVHTDEAGRPTSVDFEAEQGKARLVADGAGAGWQAGDRVADAALDPDGTLTVIAASTAFVARPHPEHESWLVELPEGNSPIVCTAGGSVIVFNTPRFLNRVVEKLLRRLS